MNKNDNKDQQLNAHNDLNYQKRSISKIEPTGPPEGPSKQMEYSKDVITRAAFSLAVLKRQKNNEIQGDKKVGRLGGEHKRRPKREITRTTSLDKRRIQDTVRVDSTGAYRSQYTLEVSYASIFKYGHRKLTEA
ncbi:hypothetical protein C922_05545 [Plasmodium inui San Antonio 1]|uniref:Uncharacterized protein n=1 Tax=Plasmodium inui San Antonio 1 TaxID=1237626 RepID=W6ZT45_9APIC|nr:hypothetical protein C922_05545 [Plasmodium inui San Antonio 1]EUD64072.1 hypothetical protein C922_05545 [Plasmodium inui San Antonio 1]